MYNGTYVYSSVYMGINKDIYLFVGFNKATYPPVQMKLYHFKIWLDDNLRFNGIPARRDSDGEIGMYDTVTNTFFTNSGTGEFIGGPVVNLYLPSGN